VKVKLHTTEACWTN